MASANSAPLNAEPSHPRDREANHLPPKSYKDAVEQGPSTGIQNGANGANGVNSANDDFDRPELNRQESLHEYTANGLDESPKGSPRKRRSLRKSVDLDEEETNTTKKKSSKSKNRFIFENFEDEISQEKLVSVGPRPSNGKAIPLRELKNDPERRKLVSGKEAGKGWGRSKIRFAPWNVPLHRRLQTLAVLFHVLSISNCVALFFLLCAIPILWPLIMVYMIYISLSKASFDGKLSYRSEAFRSSSIWSLFASYFPARLHRMQELTPTRKYIFGYHPHGIISHGAYIAFCTEALGFKQLFPGITNTLLTLESNFRIPVYRDYALALGLASVSKSSCEAILSTGGINGEGMGRAITIVVGGASESLDAHPHTLRLVLRRRYGFVKLALRTGADLVPVLAFGENDLYDQVTLESHPTVHKFQLIFKKVFGWTVPLFHARGIFNYDVGLMPYRRPINVVVGRPIPVEQNSKPTQEQVEELHEKYMQELQRIWDLWKDDFAPDRKEELMFVE